MIVDTVTSPRGVLDATPTTVGGTLSSLGLVHPLDRDKCLRHFPQSKTRLVSHGSAAVRHQSFNFRHDVLLLMVSSFMSQSGF